MSYKHTIAFYNIENLFDTKDDVYTDDDDFLPKGKKRWTLKRYKKKIKKLGRVISQIGDEDSNFPPAFVGLAEVENRQVVEDLINGKHLRNYNYNLVHYDSSDERGIDVALIYNQDVFNVTHSETFSVYLEKENGQQDFTRDILLVTGKLNDEQIHVIINHWSSRREGVEATEYKRLAAADKVNQIILDLKETQSDPKIIVMGDFNDTAQNNSLLSLENSSQLYNPFKLIDVSTKGSLTHFSEWFVFDQILFSNSFFDSKSTKLNFIKADVFNSKFLTQYRGKYVGQPFRTYVGLKYKGGYSDHFPVYIILKEDA
ncbi:endonuclease/exonuclease/phosphatase family protein [Winogradskyella litorisediminis]|uniref:Endonuclease/exonuclease/phosphatase family protein n=1 Tax=Winogradskyella litorisediminis TaxID=1156618 RepID=A0ABW3N8Y7_9FLAO